MRRPGAYDSTDVSAEVTQMVVELGLAERVKFLGVRSGFRLPLTHQTFREATVSCFPKVYLSESSAGPSGSDVGQTALVGIRWRGLAAISPRRRNGNTRPRQELARG